MKIRCLPAGFIVPAQPIKASKPPSGADWVHEIKDDGYRLIVCREGRRIKAESFTIDPALRFNVSAVRGGKVIQTAWGP
jgi:hypothetical protein